MAFLTLLNFPDGPEIHTPRKHAKDCACNPNTPYPSCGVILVADYKYSDYYKTKNQKLERQRTAKNENKKMRERKGKGKGKEDKERMK